MALRFGQKKINCSAHSLKQTICRRHCFKDPSNYDGRPMEGKLPRLAESAQTRHDMITTDYEGPSKWRHRERQENTRLKHRINTDVTSQVQEGPSIQNVREFMKMSRAPISSPESKSSNLWAYHGHSMIRNFLSMMPSCSRCASRAFHSNSKNPMWEMLWVDSSKM